MELNKSFLWFYQKYMYLIGLIGHSLFIFQIYKIWVNKSAEDVSLIGFVVACFSIASWLTYGILIKDKVLIWVNAFGFLVSLLCILMIIFI